MFARNEITPVIEPQTSVMNVHVTDNNERRTRIAHVAMNQNALAVVDHRCQLQDRCMIRRWRVARAIDQAALSVGDSVRPAASALKIVRHVENGVDLGFLQVGIRRVLAVT